MRLSAAAVAFAVLPSLATADTRVAAVGGPPGLSEPIAPLPPPADTPREDEPTGLELRRQTDAGSTRAFGSGTALTVPRGKFELSWRGPVVPIAGTVGVSAGLTDRFHVGITGMYLVDESDGGFALGAVTGKYQLMRSGTAALAVHAGVFKDPDGDSMVGWGGAIASTCVGGPRCGTIASGHVSALFADELDSDAGSQIPIIVGGSLISGERTAKLVLELLAAEIDHERGLFGFGGLRFGGRSASFDIGMGFAAVEGEAIPLPFATLNLRP